MRNGLDIWVKCSRAWNLAFKWQKSAAHFLRLLGQFFANWFEIFCIGKLSYWAIHSKFRKIEYHCMKTCQNGLKIGYFQNQWKSSKIAYLRIDFSLISSKETPQYVCRILKPLKRAFQNWSYMPKTSISKGNTTIFSKAYKISKIMLFSRRFFLLKIGKPYLKWT